MNSSLISLMLSFIRFANLAESCIKSYEIINTVEIEWRGCVYRVTGTFEAGHVKVNVIVPLDYVRHSIPLLRNLATEIQIT